MTTFVRNNTATIDPFRVLTGIKVKFKRSLCGGSWRKDYCVFFILLGFYQCSEQYACFELRRNHFPL